MDDWPEDFRDFRMAREAELTEPYGWLTLRGFHWLDDQPAELAGLPGRWWADGDQARAHLEATPADGLTRDDHPVDGTSTLAVDEYARVPWVDRGDVRVELLRRGGRLAVRVRAATSPEREAFGGVPTYPYDPAWRLPATFTAYDAARDVEVDTIRPELRQVMHPFGEVRFTAGGEEQRLAVTKGKYGWGVEFRDPTNGEETETWRQLHFDPPEPGSGEVVLDFNRALNMWCAFTDFATCPAPIAGNVVSVPVRAGELRWR
ncbi:DUF1684 domain-containing protein [Nocardioides sp.]|uniref:DUF1684 domain-containing protein n=1 Tax=Nocardioides sp. TaxID=35761 RepID=UPI0035273C2B